MKNKNYHPEDDPMSRFGKRAKAFKYPFFFTFAALLIAVNYKLIGIWPLLLFLLSSFLWMLYLALTQITCPQCQTRLLTGKSLKDLEHCYHCGFAFSFPEKPTTNKYVAMAERKYPGKTDWHPLSAATSNFDPYRLKIDKHGRLSFQPTGANLFFGLLFAFFGLIFSFLSFFLLQFILPLAWLVGLVCALIMLLGLYLLYDNFKPIHLDSAEGFLRLGRGPDNLVKPSDIKAIQLLAQQVETTSRSHNPHTSFHTKHHMSYQNYQINLVLKDRTRRHVVSYFNRDKAIDAAQTLADHMGLPLWNGLEMREDPEI